MVAVEATLENITAAADVLRRGGLVAMPTETVYGIAVDIMNVDAVRRLFALKGRPADNPLIVHISEWCQMEGVALDLPKTACHLAERFWPGPLTLVLRKRPEVPIEVTGGLQTVAVRMPKHPVALSLISLLGHPVAAPSANRFMRLSATRVEHIDPELAAGVDMILDGGPCDVGLESTVLDVTEDPPRILRPGGTTRGDIQAALGGPLSAKPRLNGRKSPGMYPRHYAPVTPLHVVNGLKPEQQGLVFDAPTNQGQIKMPLDPAAYASSFYDVLHKLDGLRLEAIYVQRPPDSPEWEAVLDRLSKAGAGP
jgi:L-threonylcarbamoyladenylate synthase